MAGMSRRFPQHLTSTRFFSGLAAICGVFFVASATAAQISGPPDNPGKTAKSSGETTLEIAPYETLKAARGLRLADVALGNGRRGELTLRRVDVFAPDGQVVLGTPDGDVPLARPAVALFEGAVTGEADSRAFLSVSPYGVYGFVEVDGATLVISTGAAGEPRLPAIYDLASLPPGVLDPTKFNCGADQFPPFWTPSPNGPDDGGGIAAAPPCRIAQIAIDTDYEFTNGLFGGDQNAASAYAATLLGAVSAVYTRDFNCRLQISYLRLWPADIDPWDQTDMGAQLSQFQGYWNANMNGVHRNLAHFLSGRCLGGGVAWVGVICNGGYGYALSSCLGGYFPLPIQNNHDANWDLMVVAHEIGHNFGAPHTHDMTPKIDNCGGGDCTNANLGTIMSYCHTCAGGMANVRMEFHQRTINEAILPYLSGACGLTGAPFDGYALNFDGSDDSATVPGFGQIAPITEVTVEFWQYADDAGGRSAFGLNPDTTTNRFQAHVPWSNGAVYWDFGNISTGGRLSYTPPQSIVGSWQHFAFVASQSGNYMRIYRNGVLEAQKTGMKPFVRSAYDFKLGGTGGGNFFNGRLADFRVWNVARSGAEIAANFNLRLSGNEPGLLAYWRLDEGTGAALHDAAANAGNSDGTINGATWTAMDNCVGDTGSCCFYNGTCMTVTRDACEVFGGSYMGDGTSCETSGCPPVGACCLPLNNGVCQTLFLTECVARGGTFGGAGTTCAGAGPFNGHALRFDGTNDRVWLNNPAALNFGGKITIEAWIKPEALNGTRDIVMHGHRTAPNQACGLRINGGNYQIWSWNGTDHLASAPIPVEDLGQWVHLAGTHDGAAWRLYRNGVLIAENFDAFGAMQVSSPWAIGSRSNGLERYFKGAIDEVRIWNVARGGAQIAQDFRRQLSGNEPGLIGYWQFEEGAGSATADSAGNNNGSLIGGPVWTATERCRALETATPQP